jgi:hypothetical protein
LFLTAAAALAAPAADYATARRKIDLLRNDRVGPGATVTLSQGEVNAYVRGQVAKVARAGVRDARVVLGVNRATGYAQVDFPKLRQAQGQPMNRFLAWLVGGERPVRVDARITSSQGKMTVDLERVEVSGMALSGDALEWLIQKFLWRYYPDAKIGKAFELDHSIDRLEIDPAAVRVVVGR